LASGRLSRRCLFPLRLFVVRSPFLLSFGVSLHFPVTPLAFYSSTLFLYLPSFEDQFDQLGLFPFRFPSFDRPMRIDIRPFRLSVGPSSPCSAPFFQILPGFFALLVLLWFCWVVRPYAHGPRPGASEASPPSLVFGWILTTVLPLKCPQFPPELFPSFPFRPRHASLLLRITLSLCCRSHCPFLISLPFPRSIRRRREVQSFLPLRHARRLRKPMSSFCTRFFFSTTPITKAQVNPMTFPCSLLKRRFDPILTFFRDPSTTRSLLSKGRSFPDGPLTSRGDLVDFTSHRVCTLLLPFFFPWLPKWK